MAPQVVLVTGVADQLGGRLAARLAEDPDIERVLGVDTAPPAAKHSKESTQAGRVEFVHADIRDPRIAKVLGSAGVDTVVHAAPRPGPGAKERNVIGTMQLMAACQRSSTVRKLVVRSTAEVYGGGASAPAVFTEQDTPRKGDAAEVEGYALGLARRRPDVVLTVVRLAEIIGPHVDNALTRYFSLPVVPTVLGFDARVQFVHISDALAVFERAVANDLPGVFNVGGDGVLMLSQAIRRAGRVPLPVPRAAIGPATRLAGGRADLSPGLSRLLSHGRVIDTTRLKTTFGFTPKWTTTAAFDDYVRGR
ncbi:NAD-dependent epimerase/dehydratase family protein [Actinophytocola glycyrrhizae]|uniref:NAD-dependent epimerase/dehydratase family protein n=1 Tax=Actinophytocola glycyrrhizae TaxID=2044873 RepID=A0ABV9RUQ5_9PSEU